MDKMSRQDVAYMDLFGYDANTGTFNSDKVLGFDMVNSFAEGGKIAALQSTINQANSELRNNSEVKSIADKKGVSEIKTYDDIDKVNKDVKKKATKIEDDIYEKTSAPKYRIAQAAKNAAGSDKK